VSGAPTTLSELAARIGARFVGDPGRRIVACAPIQSAGPEEVAFVANPRYLSFLTETRAAAVIVAPSQATPEGLARLEAEDPYFAFREAMIALHGFRVHPSPMVSGGDGHSAIPAPGHDGGPSQSWRSGAAFIHPTASVGEGAQVHPCAVVERNAVVGPRCILYPGAYVGESVVLGEECVLFPNAVVYDRCVLGNRVTLHSNVVVGHDGFGYATHGGVHHKIPQAGVVILEDDVEIGAGCAIERAAMGETRVGRGSKFADLISIGHGTTIGQHCLLVSLVGVSGSVEVGDYVMLGGQVGIAGHLRIGDFVQVAAKTGVVEDAAPRARLGGIPGIDLDAAKRNALVGRDLYGMARRLKALEREMAALRKQLDGAS
jgi:UDP-3-O-[3-hydroxymyristoyl] glucosamine N-acyltransferase